jgi:hypothetical protein
MIAPGFFTVSGKATQYNDDFLSGFRRGHAIAGDAGGDR